MADTSGYTDDAYPEHAKMAKIADISQEIGEFIEALPKLGLLLADAQGDGFGRLFVTARSTNEILAQYFNIDLDKIETEKRQMLKQIRTQS